MIIQMEVDNRKTIELAIEQAVASNRRAINTSKRPEFTPVYEKEIADLLKAKASIQIIEASHGTKQPK